MIHLRCTLARDCAASVQRLEHRRRLLIEPMNEWSVSGRCKEPLYVVLWVLWGNTRDRYSVISPVSAKAFSISMAIASRARAASALMNAS